MQVKNVMQTLVTERQFQISYNKFHKKQTFCSILAQIVLSFVYLGLFFYENNHNMHLILARKYSKYWCTFLNNDFEFVILNSNFEVWLTNLVRWTIWYQTLKNGVLTVG